MSHTGHVNIRKRLVWKSPCKVLLFRYPNTDGPQSVKLCPLHLETQLFLRYCITDNAYVPLRPTPFGDLKLHKCKSATRTDTSTFVG